MTKTFGILHLSDRCIHKDGKKISKRFTSYDRNIGTLDIKTKKTAMHDIYCIVNIKEKCVEEYFESVNHNQIPRLIAIANWKNLKNYNLNIISKDITNSRTNLDIDNIISIDPTGSLDIDDAIHYRVIDNQIEIGIHIADPTSYIDFESDLDKELQNRCSSVYFTNETIHMLPTELATNIISLKSDIEKRSFSLIIRFNTTNYNDIGELIKNGLYEYEFKKSIIKVKKNLSYDEAQKIIDSKEATNFNNYNKYNLNDLYQIALEINKKYMIQFNDVHDMIALYMILANNLCGLKLKDIPSIVRINYKKESNINIENKELLKLYNTCLQTKAIYTINNILDNTLDNSNVKHEGLNIENYAHFTSPIRRYQDMIIHRILYNHIQNQIQNQIQNENIFDIKMEKLIELIDKINSQEVLYKFTSNIDKINQLLDDKNMIEIECKIIFIDIDSISVIYEEKNLMFKIDHVHYKLKDIVEKKINYDCIEIKLNDTIRIYRLFEKIKIKIYRLKLEKNLFKILITI